MSQEYDKEETERYQRQNRLALDCIAQDLKKLSYSSNRLANTLRYYKHELEDLERTVSSFSWQAEDLFRRVADKMYEFKVASQPASEGSGERA